ncbi:MAG: hypothetical protein K2X47_00130 [Bdellovibrionales bacterium]|nr:hypothetical protein [Bdellovibrionales bacterium]
MFKYFIVALSLVCSIAVCAEENCKYGTETKFQFYAGIPVKKSCWELCRQAIQAACKNPPRYKEKSHTCNIGPDKAVVQGEEAYLSSCEVMFDTAVSVQGIQE